MVTRHDVGTPPLRISQALDRNQRSRHGNQPGKEVIQSQEKTSPTITDHALKTQNGFSQWNKTIYSVTGHQSKHLRCWQFCSRSEIWVKRIGASMATTFASCFQSKPLCTKLDHFGHQPIKCVPKFAKQKPRCQKNTRRWCIMWYLT